MNLFKCRVILTGLLLTLAIAVPVPAQTIKDADEGTTLKQIIIFGRHSIRSSTTKQSDLEKYSTNPYPDLFGVEPGLLTPRGQQAAATLGAYFREYLLQEGLLTGDPATDQSRSYFRANTIERSFITAAKFGEGLLQSSTVPVHCYGMADNRTGLPADPVFDPVLAQVVTIDADRAGAEVQGIYGSGAALMDAYSGEISLIRSVLAPLGTEDPTAQSITLKPSSVIFATGEAIDVGGLNTMLSATDPFIMQYADNFTLENVAWGRLTPDTLSQLTRLDVLQIAIAMRMPYINQVQSSNAASHILRTMRQAIRGYSLRGAFGNATSRVLVIISSDYYVAGLAGLLRLHWTLPGYQPDFCAPGGALVFELRQSNKTKEYLVRAFYTAQTFDQLRNLTPLTLDAPPATMQLAVPGGSNSATDLDVKFTTFKKLMREAIDQKYVQPFWKVAPPDVLENVPLD